MCEVNVLEKGHIGQAQTALISVIEQKICDFAGIMHRTMIFLRMGRPSPLLSRYNDRNRIASMILENPNANPPQNPGKGVHKQGAQIDCTGTALPLQTHHRVI